MSNLSNFVTWSWFGYRSWSYVSQKDAPNQCSLVPLRGLRGRTYIGEYQSTLGMPININAPPPLWRGVHHLSKAHWRVGFPTVTVSRAWGDSRTGGLRVAPKDHVSILPLRRLVWLRIAERAYAGILLCVQFLTQDLILDFSSKKVGVFFFFVFLRNQKMSLYDKNGVLGNFSKGLMVL